MAATKKGVRAVLGRHAAYGGDTMRPNGSCSKPVDADFPAERER